MNLTNLLNRNNLNIDKSDKHFIRLLEDSSDVRRLGLLVDPLRVSLRFDVTNFALRTNENEDLLTEFDDSIEVDDLICDGKKLLRL